MVNFIITLLLFGSMEVVSKPLMGRVGAVEITLYRFVLGFFLLFFLLLFTKRVKELRNISLLLWIGIAFLGITNTFMSMSFLQLAVKHTTVAETVIIFSANPLLVMVFSILLKLEKFSYAKLVALFFGLAGMVIIVAPHSFDLTSGTLYALAAATTFAIYSTGSKIALKYVNPLVFNTISIFFGVVALALFTAASGARIIPPAHLWHETEALIALLYLGIFVSGVGYITFMNTIRELGVIMASFIFILKPAVAVLLATIFLAEHISIFSMMGMVLVVAGLGIIVWEKKRETTKKEALEAAAAAD
ncbi:EamA family transporter [bacterium]|nr:EamA family transporter [bacterium]